MPFTENTNQCVGRKILIEPEYGYGWRLVGTSPESLEVEMPLVFRGIVSNVLFDSGVAHALTAECKVEIVGNIFEWVGLLPRTDSLMDLTTTEIFCVLLLSQSEPLVRPNKIHPEFMRLISESELFVHGSAKIVLLSSP